MDEIRLLNFGLSAAASMFLWIHFNERPADMARWPRIVRHTLVAGHALSAIGSLEHYSRGSDVTFVSAGWAAYCAVLLFALWRTDRHYQRPNREG